MDTDMYVRIKDFGSTRWDDVGIVTDIEPTGFQVRFADGSRGRYLYNQVEAATGQDFLECVANG